MREISRYLFIASALSFVVLGFVHAALTPRTPDQVAGLAPRDPALREAMARGTALLTHRTTLWRLWVGFNLSHSLGLVLFGACILLIGRSAASFEAQATIFLPVAVLVSGSYAILGVLYWFRAPVIWTSVTGLCFVASWALFNKAG